MDPIAKINELIAAPSCCSELKEAAAAYLHAADEERNRAADALVRELEEDVETVDDVIAFFSSDAAAAHFGKETAEKILTGALAHKAAGGVYCNCPACTAGADLLAHKELLYL